MCFIGRDSLNAVHFECRDSPILCILNVGTVPMLCIQNVGTVPGWDIPGEPGSQVPTKSSGSHEILAEIHALSQTYMFSSARNVHDKA